MWNIFFTKQKVYYISGTIDSVRSKIEKITNRKRSDLSENISGILNDDNTFKLSQKWSMIQIGWFENRPSYLGGIITKEEKKVKLETKLRPNPMIVFLFYFFIGMILCELIGVQTFLESTTFNNVLFYSIWVLIMYGCIRYFTKALQNRFERILNIS